MFEAYKALWTDHNLGTTAASANGYREILDRIQAEGLYARRDRWRREFAAWSSDDLLRLNDAFDTALENIEDRLVPINRILEILPFGGKGVLQINLRRLQSEDLTARPKSLGRQADGDSGLRRLQGAARNGVACGHSCSTLARSARGVADGQQREWRGCL